MLLEQQGAGEAGKNTSPGPEMWDPNAEPHRSAKAGTCAGLCKDTCYGEGEGCSWCDYDPSQQIQIAHKDA